jgi:hypothetical protein
VIARAMRDLAAAAGVMRYVALRDGVIAGGASFRMAKGVAQLTGAATAPAHRRRGAQTALLSARLADAAAAGCDIAVITTQPGSKSQQNAQRPGLRFALYPRRSGEAVPTTCKVTNWTSARQLSVRRSGPHGGPFRDRRAGVQLRGVAGGVSVLGEHLAEHAANRSGHSTRGRCPQSGEHRQPPSGQAVHRGLSLVGG